MNLTDHFSLEELISSEVAIRKGIDNVPNADQIENLKLVAQTLERVREIVGPIHVLSGYRSPKVNAAVGGSPTSAHLEGYAADIVSPGYGSPLTVCKAIQGSGIPYDQLIMEGNWSHISIDPRSRQETLSAHFSDGKVTYTVGLA